MCPINGSASFSGCCCPLGSASCRCAEMLSSHAAISGPSPCAPRPRHPPPDAPASQVTEPAPNPSSLRGCPFPPLELSLRGEGSPHRQVDPGADGGVLHEKNPERRGQGEHHHRCQGQRPREPGPY